MTYSGILKRFVFLCLNSLLTNEDSIPCPGYGWQSLLSRFYVLATRLFSASSYTSVSLISRVAVENNNQAYFVPTSYKILRIKLYA